MKRTIIMIFCCLIILTACGTSDQTAAILSAEGKPILLGAVQNKALKISMDADNNGKAEVFTFYKKEENVWISIKPDGKSGQEFEACIDEGDKTKIYAASPDGKVIWLVVFERGVYSSVYSYAEGKLNKIFGDSLDMEQTEAVFRTDEICGAYATGLPVQNNRIIFRWTLNEQGVFDRNYEDKFYEYLLDNSIRLNYDIILYPEPDLDSSPTMIAHPQNVRFLKTDLAAQKNKYYDYSDQTLLGRAMTWMQIRLEDGTEGWFQIADCFETADGELLEFFLIFDFLSEAE